MSEVHSRPAPALSKWALGIAQGLILAGLAWFGRQQLGMHDQLNQLTWEMQQAQGNAAQVHNNTSALQGLDFRVGDLERRQAKDEALRERIPRPSY